MNVRHLRLLACALGCVVSNTYGADVDDRLKAAVEAPTKAFFDARPQAAGVSIGVWQRGETLTFNYHHPARGDPKPTADSIYAIASITKTFTGTLLAQAELEGKLQLRDDVRKYLPGDYPNLEFEGHPIRVFDLVNHRSGLPFLMPDQPETQPDFRTEIPMATRMRQALSTYSRTDFLSDLGEVKLRTVPGDKFLYSNAGAMLAGYLLEQLYGESYEQLLARKLLRPLRMNDTAITLTARQEAVRMRGYDAAGEPVPPPPDELQAAGALKSTVNDLLRYVAWQIREEDPAVKLAHHPFVEAGNYAVGLNWQMITSDGKRVIWQTGNVEGFHAYCIIEPELELGLVVLFNQEDQLSKAEHDAHDAMINAILRNLDSDARLLP